VVLICLEAALLIPTTLSAALLLLAQTVLCILHIGRLTYAEGEGEAALLIPTTFSAAIG
jgi:hypothetical protein